MVEVMLMIVFPHSDGDYGCLVVMGIIVKLTLRGKPVIVAVGELINGGGLEERHWTVGAPSLLRWGRAHRNRQEAEKKKNKNEEKKIEKP